MLSRPQGEPEKPGRNGLPTPKTPAGGYFGRLVENVRAGLSSAFRVSPDTGSEASEGASVLPEVSQEPTPPEEVSRTAALRTGNDALIGELGLAYTGERSNLQLAFNSAVAMLQQKLGEFLTDPYEAQFLLSRVLKKIGKQEQDPSRDEVMREALVKLARALARATNMTDVNMARDTFSHDLETSR